MAGVCGKGFCVVIGCARFTAVAELPPSDCVGGVVFVSNVSNAEAQRRRETQKKLESRKENAVQGGDKQKLVEKWMGKTQE